MKRFISLTLAAVLTCSMLMIGASAAEKAINVTVNGKQVVFPDEQPYVDENNRTMVPLRPIAEALGIQVEWDGERQCARFHQRWTAETSPMKWDVDGDGVMDGYRESEAWEFSPGSDLMVMGGGSSKAINPADGIFEDYIETADDSIRMDTQAVTKNGRTFAPVRYLAEQFYNDVLFDSATQTVKIVTQQDARYQYYYSTDKDPMEIMIENTKGITSVKITSLTVTNLTDLEPPAGDLYGAELKEFFAKQDIVVPYTLYTAERIASDRAKGYDALAGLTFHYDFQPGKTYSIDVKFTYMKENGAQRTGTVGFIYPEE